MSPPSSLLQYLCREGSAGAGMVRMLILTVKRGNRQPAYHWRNPQPAYVSAGEKQAETDKRVCAAIFVVKIAALARRSMLLHTKSNI
jgi:hypothetical protein